MATFKLVIGCCTGERSGVSAYSAATNAIDDLEGLRAGGTVVSAILRDGLPIDEATLRAEEVDRALELE